MPAQNVGAVGALRVHAVQEHRRAARVIAAVVARALRSGHRVRQVAEHDHLILVRLERRQDRRQLQRAGRRPASTGSSPRRAG